MAKDTDKKPGTEQAPADKAPATEKPDPAKVVSFEQVKTAAQEAPAEPDKSDKAPAPADQPGKNDAALRKEQEALLAEMDAKAAFHEQSKPRVPKQRADKAKPPAQKEKPAPGKKAPAKGTAPKDKGKPAAEKEAPAENGPTLAQRKKELEKELREKFGIPKSAKAVEPWVAPETETVVRIPHEKLHSFKNHPFNVDKENPKFKAFVSSIRAQGVTQPVIVRPDGKDKFEIISGHRRDAGGIEAGIPYTPCIVRALNDYQAIQQMVEDNVNNREIGTMELARALKMQLESIKHQGAQRSLAAGEVISADEVGKRSDEIIAQRNGMSAKMVQRHIALTNLVPALQEMVDGKMVDGSKKPLKMAFMPAFEVSFIKPANQEYIAVAAEGNQSTPSNSQAQRMRKLDKEGQLNADVIDGILLEEKKEVANVILSAQELGQYFGKDATPREMKDTILKLLEDNKAQQKDIAKPQKKAEQEK